MSNERMVVNENLQNNKNEVLTASILRQTVNYLRNHWADKNVGIVAATIQDGDDSISATSRYLSEKGKWLHAESAALMEFKMKFNREPDPSSLVVVTLSPCVLKSNSRYGMSCSEQLLDSGLTRVGFGCLDVKQAKDIHDYQRMGFDVELISDKNLQQTSENLFELFDELYLPGGKFSNLLSFPNPWVEIKRLIGDEPFRNLI